jgi:hypothetical protein
MADPVSWFLIETGWPVFDRSGDEIGAVDQVLGDADLDIFSGLAVTSSFTTTKVVAAERVAEITEGRIRLDLSATEVEHLDDYRE